MNMEPLPIPLTKSKNGDKSDKYCVKNKFRRNPISEYSDLCEFKIAVFLVMGSQISFCCLYETSKNLEVSGTLFSGAKIQCFCTLVCSEALLKLDTFSIEVVSTTSDHLKSLFWV